MFVGKARPPIPGMDPESFAKIYAAQNRITVAEAKVKLRAMYGDPKPPLLFEGKDIKLER